MRYEAHCLSADDMRLFLDGQSSPVEDSAVVEHLDGCAKCREALEENAGGSQWIEHVHDLLSDADGDDSVDRNGESSVAAAEPFLIANRLTFLAPSDDPRMLGRMGVYEISGVIGYGGMGVILKALEPSLNRYVALKVLWPHLAINAASRQRFAREAKAAAAVVHEHVVPIYAVDEFQGIPYIVMRYVPGRSLQERIARQGWLQVDEILRIGRQIATALDAAHAQGLVHRDVKPANILLENGIERVLVTDFGLARAADDASLTHSGMVAGTPQFMSPEQARGELMDQRSDLFSFGSVLYTMCAGHPPFRAETLVGVLTRIGSDTPRPLREINPAIPEWLATFIARLMTKDQSRRLQSASEAAQILEAELAHFQNPASVSRPDRLWARRFRRSTVWCLAGLVAAMVLVSLGIATQGFRWLTSDAPDAGVNDATTKENSSLQAQAQAHVWQGISAAVEISDLQADTLRLEQSLINSRKSLLPSGPDEWEQVQRDLRALEEELKQSKSGL